MDLNAETLPAPTPTKVQEIEGARAADIDLDALVRDQQPTVFRGLARDWPLVQRGLASPQAAMAYIEGFYAGEPVVGFRGRPEIQGRFAYEADAATLNFEARRVRLDDILAELRDPSGPGADASLYVGSTDVDEYLRGFRAENDLAFDATAFGEAGPTVSIWLGNRTVASAHYDMSNNVACCAVGRRRFTLFPPEQVGNLYPGPLEPTPGGQVVSMVDFRQPDFDRYPRFRDALAVAQVAELEPGDVLVYPALWWHHVEALEGFNVLVNYWWNPSPGFMDTPMTTLLHGILSLRDRPEHEKRGWKALFDYYVFGAAEQASKHLPEAARGDLGPLDGRRARRLRAILLNRLNR